jgi:hypothetical protein
MQSGSTPGSRGNLPQQFWQRYRQSVKELLCAVVHFSTLARVLKPISTVLRAFHSYNKHVSQTTQLRTLTEHSQLRILRFEHPIPVLFNDYHGT